MAECMGLHRDGEVYGLNPVDTHVRRLIWHQLCFLDIRTAEAHGPRPLIRREDYDTRLPRNCDEEQIHATEPQPAGEERWTTMLLPIIRFEVNEMMRVLWADRRKLRSKKITLTEVLAKTENFRKRMMDRYEGLLDDSVPIQRYARLIMHLLLYRLYAMTLHSLHHSSRVHLPARLNNVVVMAGIMMVEISIQLENDRAFRDWAWYFGAFTQYQIALLLAIEVYFRPQNREAARIWACLDYVFNLDRALPPDIKSAQVFNEVMSKTSVYNNVRNPSSRGQAVASDAAGADLNLQGGPASRSFTPPPASYFQPPATSPLSSASLPTGYSGGGHWHQPTGSGRTSPESCETGTSASSHGGAASEQHHHHAPLLPHAAGMAGNAAAAASASSARGPEGIDWVSCQSFALLLLVTDTASWFGWFGGFVEHADDGVVTDGPTTRIRSTPYFRRIRRRGRFIWRDITTLQYR
jgi:hypothetical protein